MLGSLMHLLAVLARVRGRSRLPPAPRPSRDRALVALAAVAVSALAAARLGTADTLEVPCLAGLVLIYTVLGGHVLLLAARAVIACPPRSPSL